MLKAAGVKDLDSDIWAMPVQRPYNPNAKRMAETDPGRLAKVGVNAKIVSYEWAEYRKRVQAAEHPMAPFLGWTGDNGDPDNFLAALLGCDAEGKPNGNNIPKWCDAGFQTVINKAAESPDMAERTKLYVEAQKIVCSADALAERRPFDGV